MKIAVGVEPLDCRVFGVCEVAVSILPIATLPIASNLFRVQLHASFQLCGSPALLPTRVRGFYDGNSTWRVRFSPPRPGTWHWTTNSSTDAPGLASSGTLLVALATAGDRGPVRAHMRGFRYETGGDHLSLGTTAYAWVHQNASTRAATLAALSASPFNKLRMTVFPKWYPYNYQEPASRLYPYEGTPPTNWDFARFHLPFWRHLEDSVQQLRGAGVIADLILFHPYDHWGFGCMGGSDPETYDLTHDLEYVRYAVARLAAFSNVWWSLANEWDLIRCKGKGVGQVGTTQQGWTAAPFTATAFTAASAQAGATPIWDALGAALAAEDPYRREASIHNCIHLYNHSRAWVTHVSLQGYEDGTPAIVAGRYGLKPVVWDEVRYEGDIPEGWGQLNGPEMADRFWWGHSLGVHVGHSETIMLPGLQDKDQLMWWSKGGVLRGTSPGRISWFARTVGSAPRPAFSRLTPLDAMPLTGCTGSVLVGDGYALFHVRGGPGGRPHQGAVGEDLWAGGKGMGWRGRPSDRTRERAAAPGERERGMMVDDGGLVCNFSLPALGAAGSEGARASGGGWSTGVGAPGRVAATRARRLSPEAEPSRGGAGAVFRVVRLDWWTEMETELASRATGVFRTGDFGRLPANIELTRM